MSKILHCIKLCSPCFNASDASYFYLLDNSAYNALLAQFSPIVQNQISHVLEVKRFQWQSYY